jgi:hypothetical protein
MFFYTKFAERTERRKETGWVEGDRRSRGLAWATEKAVGAAKEKDVSMRERRASDFA